MPLDLTGLTPEDIAYFTIAQRRLGETYQQGLAQNQFEQTALGGERARQLAELTAQLDAMRGGVTGQFASGGLLNSGLYQKALADYQGGRGRQIGLLEGSFQDRLGALIEARKQLETTKAGAEADLLTESQQRRAAIAANVAAATLGVDQGGGTGGRPTYQPSRATPSYAPRPVRQPAQPRPRPQPRSAGSKVASGLSRSLRRRRSSGGGFAQ